MTDADGGEGFATRLADAMDALERLEERTDAVERLDELDDRDAVLGDLEALVTVAEEAAEFIDAVDLSELPDAVDFEELLGAIDVGEVPAALADDTESDVVQVRQLVDAIDLLSAWDAAELGDLWEEKRELDDAVDDLDDGEDAGLVEDAVSDVADDDGDDLVETDIGATEAKELLGSPDPEDDPEAYQVFIQNQAMKGVDEFRAALLETHEKFERLYEYNREKMRRQDTSTNSRNPTAASTMPTDRIAGGSGVKYATVPRDVRLSTAPSRTRIYGQRFELEREKLQDDDD
ncbi:hypothetical protein [Halopiger djelfimassiliensis]|uniref:hypothetical protein n=1 Tax=Halopiger djelfimassiliensis TaxID=1293047 RepID=UPI000677C4EC|nr:hypothetical protein [Halopiger djelfimassiliensis]